MESTIYGAMKAGDVESDLISRFLHDYGEWAFAEALIASTLTVSDDTLWDVGAHLGTFSLGVDMNSRLGRVLCIDANADVVDDLNENLGRNLRVSFDSVLTGVAAYRGFGSIQLADPLNRGSARLVLSDKDCAQAGPLDVPATTLGALRARFGDYSFLKLDIEGMEADAIDGDRHYILERKPVIWAECNQSAQSFVLLDQMLSVGYIPLYVAFPSIRSDNFRGNHEMFYPMAYEAALVGATPERLARLSFGSVCDPCILRTVNGPCDLRKALWDTPRWARKEWVGLSKPELVARIGRLDRGERFDSFIDGQPPVGESDDVARSRNVAPCVRLLSEGMVQIYWLTSEVADASFSEDRSLNARVQLDGSLQALSFPLPDGILLGRVRIHPLDRIGVISIDRIVLVDRLHQGLWTWDGNCELLENLSGIEAISMESGFALVCVNTEPQFEILVPPSVFARGVGPVTLRIEMRAEELETGLASLTAANAHRLARRDDTIAQQQQHLRKVREELLRAEARLELLKELRADGQQGDGL